MPPLQLRRVGEGVDLGEWRELHANALSLHHLVLHDCRLGTLSGLPSLPSLVELNLSSNHLTALGPAEAWGALQSLRSLDLSANRLSGLPFKGASKLPSLRTLLVPDNFIESLAGIGGEGHNINSHNSVRACCSGIWGRGLALSLGFSLRFSCAPGQPWSVPFPRAIPRRLPAPRRAGRLREPAVQFAAGPERSEAPPGAPVPRKPYAAA